MSANALYINKIICLDNILYEIRQYNYSLCTDLVSFLNQYVCLPCKSVCMYVYMNVVLMYITFIIITTVPSCYVSTSCDGNPIGNISTTFFECCTSLSGVSFELERQCRRCPSSGMYCYIYY